MGDLSHDDYKRLLVVATLDEAFIHLPADRDKAMQIRSRWFVYAHEQRFGSKPTNCLECKDDEATRRALNCDEHGNPYDGGPLANYVLQDDK
jgi:hypothetical protein